jgi:hypothetical protein
LELEDILAMVLVELEQVDIAEMAATLTGTDVMAALVTAVEVAAVAVPATNNQVAAV